MTDKEWEDFVKWWKSKWAMSAPNRESAEQYLKWIKETSTQPTIVCLCGSTRFKDTFSQAQLEETLAGKIVLTIGCNMKSDTEIFGHLSDSEFDEIKAGLDELHLRKIELADEVLILNVDGYIGESTRNELNYAIGLGKTIRYWQSPNED